MKKSILALGAAATLGGLGFAGSAHAIAYFGADEGVTTATHLALNPGSVGHILLTPYYSAQGSTSTLFSITNTHDSAGKAVKVRFRGAANSDDVLDFTVFLSPNDVWTAELTRGADGFGRLTTPDTSCTLPAQAQWPAKLDDLRLAPYLDQATKAINANEGYIEVLNMADIPVVTTKEKTSLYENIKHVNGVAPCDAAGFQTLLNTTVVNNDGANAAGLAAPSGGLMGSWALFNQDERAVYSGNMTAITAYNGDSEIPGAVGGWSSDLVTPIAAPANIVFAPQRRVPVSNQELVDKQTADPLLSGLTRKLDPLWYDLPDLSTPLVNGDPIAQAERLSQAMERESVLNDYVATAANASVPMHTDWIVSQPTRRYHAAVNYARKLEDAEIVHREGTAEGRYSLLDLDRANQYGPQACMEMRLSTTDREEGQVTESFTGDFSPGEFVTFPYCGEVFTLSFSDHSVLNATVTNRQVSPFGVAGWGRLGTIDGRYLPMIGFAATSVVNNNTSVAYGWTLPHRWDR